MCNVLYVTLSNWEKVPVDGRSESLDKRFFAHIKKFKQTWEKSLDKRFYSHKKEEAKRNMGEKP